MDLMEPIWERQPGEPSLWYNRFHAFKLSGKRRAVLAIYNRERAEAGESGKKRTPGSWDDAVIRWRWRERAEAFDASIRAEQEAEWRERTMPEGQVLAGISDQAALNIEDFFRIGKSGKPILDLRKAQEAGKLHLIKGFRYDRQGRLIVEFHDAQRAFELMGKYHKLFREGVEHSGNIGVTLNFLGDLSGDELKQRIARLEAMEAAGTLPAVS